MHIAMIAAENGALLGGKVGGIGDVIRDVPMALARHGHDVSVIMPGYQSLARRNPSSLLGSVQVPFCGVTETVAIFRVEDKAPRRRKAGGVTHYVLEHPGFAASGEGL